MCGEIQCGIVTEASLTDKCEKEFEKRSTKNVKSKMKILCQCVNKCCYCLQIKQYNELADNNVLDKAEHIQTSED